MTRSATGVGFLYGAALALTLALPAQAETARDLPLDRPTHVNDLQVACTGVGDGAQNKTQWSRYPVKLEAVGGYGQYLADETVTIDGRDGAQMMRVRCDAPWVLMRLDPGHYAATVDVSGASSKHVRFMVPAEGQSEVIVRFPKMMAGRDMSKQG